MATLRNFFTAKYIVNRRQLPDLNGVDPLPLLEIIKNCQLFHPVFDIVDEVILDRHDYYAHASRLDLLSDDACETALMNLGVLSESLENYDNQMEIIQSF